MPGSIRIVMVDTSHPGNIGAAARAMKNMCLTDLVLVRPKQFPHPEAVVRASGADDVLAQARVVPDVGAALADCGLVIATTSRARDQNFRVLDARTAAHRLVQAAAHSPVAVLFGSERAGLTNDELERAHALLRIPTGDAYASLNIAMAIQIVAYEILCAQRESPAERPRESSAVAMPNATERAVPLASAAAMEQFYVHLAQVMTEVQFRDRTQSGTSLMRRIRRLFQRAELDANEVNILRGFLTAVQQRRRRAGQELAR